jgi:hypothetical protein
VPTTGLCQKTISTAKGGMILNKKGSLPYLNFFPSSSVFSFIQTVDEFGGKRATLRAFDENKAIKLWDAKLLLLLLCSFRSPYFSRVNNFMPSSIQFDGVFRISPLPAGSILDIELISLHP